MKVTNMENPFTITSPEGLTADETVSLFVDVFTDFYHITSPGNVLLKGPRGVGKSMMLRYLEPDCQCLANSKKLNELPYIAIYVPLKNTNFALAELRQFEGRHAYLLINEHIMVVHCLIRVFDNLKNYDMCECIDKGNLMSFYKNFFLPILELSDNELEKDCELQSVELIERMLTKLTCVYKSVMRYVKNMAFIGRIEPYSGELYDYNNYFIPVLEALTKAISDDKSVFYLLLDDAHYLSEVQTRILNSWIASRTTRKVSIKVSTQYNYKTYYTPNGSTIDTPHDYVEIDMATVYTEGNKATYYARIKDIVEKRLVRQGIASSAEEFFPDDVVQEEKIREIEKEYIDAFDRGEGRGHNRTDDARRYARPDYIKSLAGKSKSSHTYSYSGFWQLVNISSGVVRYFLQQAHSMYAKQRELIADNLPIEKIDPSVQNLVVRERANQVLFSDLEAYANEGHEEAYPKENIEKLSNLIQGLGGLFRSVLCSDKSERRIFSIVISDTVSDEVREVLNIGIQLGYFHKSTIGTKYAGSIGRTRLYVLNRMLAPVWNLDPNGFAGYLFLKNEVLENAIRDPFKMITKSEIYRKDKKGDDYQISLFDLYPDELQMEKEVEVLDGED